MNYLEKLIKYGETEYRQINPGLDRIAALLDKLGNPQHLQKYILVGGTNGKGSVAHLIAHLLQHQLGLKVGLYTSPHLYRINERFMINREAITDIRFDTLLRANDYLPLQEQGTFFEVCTALAIQYFSQEKTDINVLEVGLGGRFDATNIVDPIASIVVSIGHDHMEILGDTLEKVALEKMGIFRKDAVNIVGSVDAPIKKYMQRNCEFDLQFYEDFAGEIVLPKDLPVFFNSDHQQHNLKLAMYAVGAGFPRPLIAGPSISGGETPPLRDFYISGRTEIRGNTILDGAHNPEAAIALKHFLEKNYPGEKFNFLIGMANSKDPKAVLEILQPLMNELHLCEFNHSRSITIAQWKNIIAARYWKNPHEAVSNINRDCKLVITGSFFLIADVLHQLRH